MSFWQYALLSVVFLLGPPLFIAWSDQADKARHAKTYRLCIAHHPVAECRELR